MVNSAKLVGQRSTGASVTNFPDSDDTHASNIIAETSARKPIVGFLLTTLLVLSILLMGVVTLTTIATWFAKSNWLADLCANLRIQQMIGLLGLTTFFVLLRRWRLVGLGILLLVVHLPAFWTLRLRPASNPAINPDLIVMTVNVWTPNRKHDLIADQILQSGADIVAVLELGSPLHARLGKELATAYPHRFTFPQDRGNFGIGLYSKYPLADRESFSLNVDSILSLGATVEIRGERYRVLATHPLPPMGASGFKDRNEHLTQLAAKIRAERSPDNVEALIVMGDLNLTPWSPLFGQFEADSQVYRAKRGYGLTPTWYAYANASFPFGLMLDHVLASEDLHCFSHQVGDAMGSDHRAVTVGLSRR